MKPPASLKNYVLPRLQDVLFILIFFFILRFGSNLLRDGDPGRHITIGKYMIENHSILTHDIFSYTMYGQPLTPHEWLAQVAFGAFYLALGMSGVILLAAIVIAITAVLVYREILRRNLPHLIAFVLALWAVGMTSAHWLARPHLFTLLFLALWTPRLCRLSEGESLPLWQFPLIMLIWANTHGGFIAGFVVWGILLAAWLWDNFVSSKKPSRIILRNLCIAGGASFIVTFFNPAGWRLWVTSLGYVTNRYLTEFTREYRSLDFHSIGAWPFLAFLTLAFLILSRAWKKLPTSESFLLAGWLPLALYSGRNMPLFAIIATPILAGQLQPIIKSSPLAERLTNPIENIEHQLRGGAWTLLAVISAGIFMGTGHTFNISGTDYQFNSIEFPVAAVNWLESHPQSGNIYNFCRWGGYLIYRMWPAQHVFIDGQTDFYGEQFTRQYEQVQDADSGWREVLKQYDIQWILVPPNTPIALVLQNDPAWSVIYQDQTSVIIRQH